MQPGPGGYPGAPAPYNPYAQQQQGQPGEPGIARRALFVPPPALLALGPADGRNLRVQVPGRRWQGLEATRSSSSLA